MEKLTIIVREEDGSFWVNYSKFGHIVAVGKTEQEAINNLKEKIEIWLSDPRRKEWLDEYNQIKNNVKLRHIK
jgi:predicted RNase H-like HicB family nuclease